MTLLEAYKRKENLLVSDFKHDGFLLPIKVLHQGHDMSLRVFGVVNLCELLLDLDGSFFDFAGSSCEVEGPKWPQMRRRSHEMMIAQEYDG